ncbi:uncharacterized protein LOC132267109 [Cornus florida]|uniref:uncharacterized protein LOC132267109 n=1 Tax=Cornus florida TaxID=4283 RepID=UPI0028994B16|nr:uncharacterized protein LOC132267109 [Cornus florida]
MKETLSKLKDAVKPVISEVEDAIEPVISRMEDAINPVISKVEDVIEPVISEVAQVATAIKPIVSEMEHRAKPIMSILSETQWEHRVVNIKLYRALVSGDLSSVKEILDKHPYARVSRISTRSETAIHIAASHGHAELVDEILKRIDVSDLAFIQDDYGDTALHVASRGGNTTIAKALFDKASNAGLWLPIKNDDQHIPLTLAAVYNNEQMFHFLRHCHSIKDGDHGLIREFLGSLFLDSAVNKIMVTEFIKSENYDLALKLWEREDDNKGVVHGYLEGNLNRMAKMVSAFSNKNQLGYFKSWIYKCIDVQPVSIQRSTSDLENQLGDSSSPPLSSSKCFKVLHFLQGLMSNVAKAIGIEEVSNMKIKNMQAHELLSKMCSPIWTFDPDFVEVYFEAIKVAIRCGNAEFVEEVLRSNPALLWGNKKSGTIFHIALAFRQEKIWNLLYGLNTEQRNKATGTLVDSNSMLHIAAYPLVVSNEAFEKQEEQQLKKQGEQQSWKIFSKAPGAAMKVQRELQWYKEVERMVPSSFQVLANKDDETPLELFSKSHSELVKEGEKWMRETATSCTIVATLIVTVMFAAAFTLPGGLKDNSGMPQFQGRNSFKVFIISDALSLFSSVTAVLMFLSILTSRFEEEDFLKALPKRLIIGLATHFLSIATMMIAFGVTLYIAIGEQIKSAATPIILLASVPVTLFALLQFPLFVDMISSTYGRSIFNRSTKCSFFNNPNDYIPKENPTSGTRLARGSSILKNFMGQVWEGLSDMKKLWVSQKGDYL